MKRHAVLLLLLLLLFAGCTSERYEKNIPLPPVEGTNVYLAEIKPILDKRCVVCHSCYNSPCQLKLSSYEGLDRGGSKEAVYNSKRLWSMEPTRLFVDAMTTEQWRDRNFHSVRESTAAGGENNSLMMKMLTQKKSVQASSCAEDINDSCNSFRPEDEKLTCASTVAEMDAYLTKHPNRGMPYGFPPLEEKEFRLISDWLRDGGRGPTIKEHRERAAVAETDMEPVKKWEAFLNAAPADNELKAKYQMTARYLYEHLFLAHISFDPKSRDFYEIVRSTTPPGEDIRIIPTVRPYDDPGEGPFYYRFRRIYSTIVHKTHMVFELSDAKMARFQKLFIEPEWPLKPHWVEFDQRTSANPFAVFEQIPARSRYQFLLDNNHYIIMTFIRGPVCKGQVALNVIQDNFWLFFLDPEYDLSVQRPEFLHNNLDLTAIPIEQGSFFSMFKSWMIVRYKQLAYRYVTARQDLYAKNYGENGLDYRAIWAGSSGAGSPALTVFRHFNSASVHPGLLGDLPRTAWVMDFPLMERIYYALVAGFDVYGSMGHQLGVRMYMDNLRQEGETYFLDFMPKRLRGTLLRSWYGGIDPKKIHYTPSTLETGVRFATLDPKREFIEQLVKGRFIQDADIAFDENYHEAGATYPAELPLQYRSEADYIRGFDTVSAPGTKFFSFINDYNANLAYVRIRIAPDKDQVVSIVVHRWHDDVQTLSQEKEKLNAKKDEVDFIRGYVGSYPNYFFDVPLEELSTFLSMLQKYDNSKQSMALLLRYGVNRADKDFWEKYDWFQQDFDKSDPLRAGLFDLNRYYHLAIDPTMKEEGLSLLVD